MGAVGIGYREFVFFHTPQALKGHFKYERVKHFIS